MSAALAAADGCLLLLGGRKPSFDNSRCLHSRPHSRWQGQRQQQQQRWIQRSAYSGSSSANNGAHGGASENGVQGTKGGGGGDGPTLETIKKFDKARMGFLTYTEAYHLAKEWGRRQESTWDEDLAQRGLARTIFRKIKPLDSFQERLPTLLDAVLSGVGVFCAFAVLGWIDGRIPDLLILRSRIEGDFSSVVGAMATLSAMVFALPTAETIRLHTILIGTLISTIASIVLLEIYKHSDINIWMMRAIFLGTAVALMRASRVIYPPSTAIVVAAASLPASCEAPAHSSLFCCVYGAVIGFAVVLSTGFLINAVKRVLLSASVNAKPPS